MKQEIVINKSILIENPQQKKFSNFLAKLDYFFGIKFKVQRNFPPFQQIHNIASLCLWKYVVVDRLAIEFFATADGILFY